MKTKNKKKRFNRKKERPEFEQRLLDLARVTRVVKGGRRFRFRATMVIGNRRGKIGVGVAKGSDVSDAINKAVNDAKKHLVEVNIWKTTIPHDIRVKLGSAKIMLRPAREGRGIVAGGAMRTVINLAGIKDIVAKSLGTANKLNVARATLLALSELQAIEENKSKNNFQSKPEKENETLTKKD